MQLKQYEQEQAKLRQLRLYPGADEGLGHQQPVPCTVGAMSIQHRMERIEKTERPKQGKDHARQLRREGLSRRRSGIYRRRAWKKPLADTDSVFRRGAARCEGGERIALLGDNGAGKTTFLRCLLGQEPCEGKIKFGPTVKWGYLPQTIHFAHPERSLYDTMLYEKNLHARRRPATDLAPSCSQGEDVFKPVGKLSGGEQSRLRLCMLMDEKINLLDPGRAHQPPGRCLPGVGGGRH